MYKCLNSIYPFLDTAYAFVCLQAVETLTTIARDATDVLNSATGREIVIAPGQALEADIAEPVSPRPDMSMPIAHTSRVREENHNPDQNSEVFEEEVANIAQVHCMPKDLFEFELSDQPPRVFVKGNLRRNVEFWKRIGTSKFILN